MVSQSPITGLSRAVIPPPMALLQVLFPYLKTPNFLFCFSVSQIVLLGTENDLLPPLLPSQLDFFPFAPFGGQVAIQGLLSPSPLYSSCTCMQKYFIWFKPFLKVLILPEKKMPSETSAQLMSECDLNNDCLCLAPGDASWNWAFECRAQKNEI